MSHSLFDLIITQFQSPVMAAAKLIDAPLRNVETDNFILFAKGMRQRQPDITKAYYRYLVRHLLILL